MPTRTATLLIPTPDGRADAFAVFPDHGGPHPGVLMYPDAFGIRPVIREMARELAGHGYYVLVPNFFHRHGPSPVELPEYIDDDVRVGIIGQLMPLVRAHTTDLTLRDADAFVRFLTARPEVAAGPVAVTGYCFGGLLALRTASAHPGQVAAVAGFHGPVAAEGPDGLHRLLSAITAEVHLGHAASDLSPETLAALDRALDAAGLRYTSEIYPGTVHGFTMSDTSAFDPEGLKRHWEHLLPLLDRALT
ncbi:dienelactone hydrolase family protein [Kitasatospora sp. NPDC048722]|uniref:dienelactone hydrolase family protein n=1 Tax=Kitasatospora sp. NPDC048722 TaxID=3155639 RepID=UPI0033C758EB